MPGVLVVAVWSQPRGPVRPAAGLVGFRVPQVVNGHPRYTGLGGELVEPVENGGGFEGQAVGPAEVSHSRPSSGRLHLLRVLLRGASRDRRRRSFIEASPLNRAAMPTAT